MHDVSQVLFPGGSEIVNISSECSAIIKSHCGLLASHIVWLLDQRPHVNIRAYSSQQPSRRRKLPAAVGLVVLLVQYATVRSRC